MAAKGSRKRSAARRPKVAVQGITPFLWYDGKAQEAAEFYVSLFKGSKVTSATP